MLSKRYRLVRSEDFHRINREGQSWSNRLLVLCRASNSLPYSRFGFSVSRRIGKAVVRNRTKRLMREVVRLHYDLISSGWDVVFIARRPIVEADYGAVERSVIFLLRAARMLSEQEQV